MEIGAEVDEARAIFLWRDVGPCALVADELPDPVGIVATIRHNLAMQTLDFIERRWTAGNNLPSFHRWGGKRPRP